MSSPTVSLCVFAHNDLPFLRIALAHASRWVDQLCVLDLGSTDGTREFCEAYLKRTDAYVRRDTNTVSELGFDEARRAVSDMGTSDWIFTGGANTVLDWTQWGVAKDTLAAVKGDVVQIETINIAPYLDRDPARIEEAVARGRIVSRETHRIICRRDCGLVHRGYIHEELFRGEVNCHGESVRTPLRRYHFQGWGNHPLRSQRYGWMLCRAIDNPALQKYTNRWWYDDFFPANEKQMRENAALYEKYMAETGMR